MAYLTTIPVAGSKLSVSQPQIQGNFLTANTVMDIDHYPFNDVSTEQGYHKVIHQPPYNGNSWQPTIPQTGQPGLIANVNQLLSLYYTPDSSGAVTDTQLFAESAAGNVYQLTGNLKTQEGWAWMGGMLVQWGRVTFAPVGGQANGTVIFKDRDSPTNLCIPFPNACLFVIPSFFRTNSSTLGDPANSITIVNTGGHPTDKTQFSWAVNVTSTLTIFNWVAVGY